MHVAIQNHAFRQTAKMKICASCIIIKRKITHALLEVRFFLGDNSLKIRKLHEKEDFPK